MVSMPGKTQNLSNAKTEHGKPYDSRNSANSMDLLKQRTPL